LDSTKKLLVHWIPAAFFPLRTDIFRLGVTVIIALGILRLPFAGVLCVHDGLLVFLPMGFHPVGHGVFLLLLALGRDCRVTLSTLAAKYI